MWWELRDVEGYVELDDLADQMNECLDDGTVCSTLQRLLTES